MGMKVATGRTGRRTSRKTMERKHENENENRVGMSATAVFLYIEREHHRARKS